MSALCSGDGIAIDPLDANERKLITVVKAEEGLTRIRISDAESNAVLEINVLPGDARTLGRFLLRCAK